MVNPLSKKNLTEEEIKGWIENDDSLLPLEDSGVEISDDEQEQEISNVLTANNENKIKFQCDFKVGSRKRNSLERYFSLAKTERECFLNEPKQIKIDKNHKHFVLFKMFK